MELYALNGELLYGEGVGDPTIEYTEGPYLERTVFTVVGDQSSHRYWNRCIELITNGQIDVTSMVTHHFGLDEIHVVLAVSKATLPDNTYQ